jgi:hypothetical protein
MMGQLSISSSLIKLGNKDKTEEEKTVLPPSDKPNEQEEAKSEKPEPAVVPKKISNKQKKRLEKQKLEHEKYLQNKKLKSNEWSNADFDDRVMNKEKIDNITILQKSLCANAFKLLKIGGIIVYSTCSFATAQNEDVVDYLLNQCPETKNKLTLENPFEEDMMKNAEFRKGLIDKTIRFDPVASKNGGMFIAKMTKTID